jgi:hypothetical protein
MTIKRHKHADLIHAWAEGEQIEVSYLGQGQKVHDKFWLPDPNPIWCPILVYRIAKPKIKQFELEISNG